MMRNKKKVFTYKNIPVITLYIIVKLRAQLLNDKLLLIYCNKIYNRSKLGGPKKKFVGQKTWRANKLAGPNTKPGGPVPGRPTCSAVTELHP